MDSLNEIAIVDAVRLSAKRERDGKVIKKTSIVLLIDATDDVTRYLSDKAFELARMVKNKEAEDPKIPIDGSTWAIKMNSIESPEDWVEIHAWANKATIKSSPSDEFLPSVSLVIDCKTEDADLVFLWRHLKNAISIKFTRRQMDFTSDFINENGIED